MEKTNAELKAEVERLQLAVYRGQQENYKLRQQNKKKKLSEHKHLTDETIKVLKSRRSTPLVLKSDDNDEDCLYIDTDSIINRLGESVSHDR